MVKTPHQSAGSVAVPPAEYLDPRVLCPFCREEIGRGAKICAKCKSDLTWKRYLAFSNTTLALLTALIAVVGTVGPQVYRLVTPADSELSATLIGENTEGDENVGIKPTIVVLMVNEGTRPGTVLEALLELPIQRRPGHEYAQIQLNLEGGFSYVKEKTSQHVSLALPPMSPAASAPGRLMYRGTHQLERQGRLEPTPGRPVVLFDDQPCRLNVRIVSGRGKESSLPLTFDCSRLAVTVMHSSIGFQAGLLPAFRVPQSASAPKRP